MNIIFLLALVFSMMPAHANPDDSLQVAVKNDDSLQVAVKNNDVDEAREVLALGANPNLLIIPTLGPGLIHILETTCNLECQPMMELLLQSGADPNPGLRRTAHNENTEIAKILFRFNADANTSGALSIAVSRHHIGMTKLLLANKADPNAIGGREQSRPLMYAIFSITRCILDETINFSPNYEIIEALVANGADAELPVYRGKEVAHYLAIVPGICNADLARLRTILNLK